MNRFSKQTGATLITALVMLVVLTLLVISGVRSSTTNLRIVGNMQIQEESSAAARQAIEQVISNNFTVNPTEATIPVVVAGVSYRVVIAKPVCSGSRALPNNSPSLPPECISSGAAQNTGIVFASSPALSGTSWCYAQQWEVQANVSDSSSGSAGVMHQGVSLNVPAGTGC